MHGMNVYEHSDIKRWVIGELSKLSTMAGFDSSEDMAKAVHHLLACHQHHFVVLPDPGFKIAVSEMAMECLRNALATDRWLG